MRAWTVALTLLVSVVSVAGLAAADTGASGGVSAQCGPHWRSPVLTKEGDTVVVLGLVGVIVPSVPPAEAQVPASSGSSDSCIDLDGSVNIASCLGILGPIEIDNDDP